MIRATLLLFSFLLSYTASQAGVLKGIIKDNTGEQLPFATVFIKGTTMGTAANASAEYQLSLAPGTYKVSCQYLGYEQSSVNITIQGNETITQNFTLSPQTMQMESVVIKAGAEDPAYAIMRKAIAKRKFHLEQVKEFQSSIYMKGVIRNRDFPGEMFGVKVIVNGDDVEGSGGGADSNSMGVVYLSEQEADYYSDGKREQTIIRSVRESGDPNGLGISRLPPIVSFYENNVNPLWDISERGFISPVSENAMLSYRYKYEGEFMQDGYRVNKIKVIPRRAYEPVFSGDIYIIEDEWAIHSLNLSLTNKTGLNFIDTLRVEQTYLPLKKDLWVIKSQVQYPVLSIFGFGFTANFVTIYDDHKINQPIPDSIFSNDKVVAKYAKDAQNKDTSYWTENRVLPLEEDEVEDYKKRDSIHAVTSSPEYRDSIRKRGNKLRPMGLLMSGYSYSSKEYKNRVNLGSLLSALSFNSVEGLVVAPDVSTVHQVDSNSYISTHTGVRYGFSNQHFNAATNISYTHRDASWRTRQWTIGMQGGRYVHQFNPGSTVAPLYNTITTLLNGYNILNLYENWMAAGYFRQNLGTGFTWHLKAGFQRRLPLYNTTYYNWAGKNAADYSPNQPYILQNRIWEAHNAVLVKAGISYQPGYRYIQYPDHKSPITSGWPVFTLEYEKGISGILDSKADFDKWRAGMTDDINLKLLGNLEYNIAAGGFLNDNYVSLPDMMHIADNELYLASPYLYSFQLAPYYLFSNTAELYTEAHVEYNLNGFLTNKIPLFRRLQWHLVTGGNALYIDDNNYYTEAYIGLDNIGYKFIRFLRVDVVRSWDSYGYVNTGVRFGLDVGAIGVGESSSKRHYDW